MLSKEDLSHSILGAKRITGGGGWGCHPSSWPRSSAQPAAGLGLSPQIGAGLGVPGAQPLGQMSLWQSCKAGVHPAGAQQCLSLASALGQDSQLAVSC